MQHKNKHTFVLLSDARRIQHFVGAAAPRLQRPPPPPPRPAPPGSVPLGAPTWTVLARAPHAPR